MTQYRLSKGFSSTDTPERLRHFANMSNPELDSLLDRPKNQGVFFALHTALLRGHAYILGSMVHG